MWFAAWSFIKGIFTKTDSSTRLSLYFIIGIVAFIGILFLLNGHKKHQIEQLKQQNAVATQALNIAEQTNKALNKTLEKQQVTQQQAVEVVQKQFEQKEKIHQETKKHIQYKEQKIASIKEKTQEVLKQEPQMPQEKKQQLKEQEQNQISLVQIQSIWQAYCSAQSDEQCSSNVAASS